MRNFLSSEPLHNPLAAPALGGTTEIKCTTCYMCACRCGIRVHLREGDNGPEVRYIDGNPAHPLNKGVICAKGASGIMKQVSPARLTRPLLRKAGSERGAGEFEAISWARAFDLLTERLGKIRATDPKKFALFTGRDQMQALTGLFARQFGTPNYAAHGGFCAVNMAAGMIYTVGGSFWEFGGPDLDRAKLFVMIGTAEDHHSNPMKIAISQFKRDGGRFISINPVRTGDSAIADEWIPIKPGMDGLLALSVVHVLLSRELFDWEFLVRYTNAPWMVVQTPGKMGDGLFLRDEAGNPLVWDLEKLAFVSALDADIAPAVFGEFVAPDGRPVKTSMQLMAERYLDERYAPENVAAECGVPAEAIERMAGSVP